MKLPQAHVAAEKDRHWGTIALGRFSLSSAVIRRCISFLQQSEVKLAPSAVLLSFSAMTPNRVQNNNTQNDNCEKFIIITAVYRIECLYRTSVAIIHVEARRLDLVGTRGFVRSMIISRCR